MNKGGKMEIFGIRLKKELTEQNKKQTELAKYLNVGKSTVTEWINGKNEPSMRAIAEIAIFLDVSTDYLFGLEDETGTKVKIHNSFNNNSGNINFKG